MKKEFIRFFTIGALLLFTTVSTWAAPTPAPLTLTLDPTHTYILWHIKHFGFSTQAGKWYVNGNVIFDQAKPENSQVKATIQVGDIVTGLTELDKHLKDKLFFDIEQFPTATFVSNKITVTGKSTAKIEGLLTLHGVTKPITLVTKLNQAGENPVTHKPTFGFSANTTLKRSDFGMTAFLPALSDEVKLDIEVEAYKP
jgi:polyisoprenoid-binding protein YceI